MSTIISIKLRTLLVLIILFSIIRCTNATNKEIAINNLTVEYSTTPLGIDVEKPRFSWQMNAYENKRGYYQIAYHIEVKNHTGKVVWNSEKVNTATALSIVYQGEKLKASTKYNWTVKVWDQNNKEYSANSWFETGLMNPSQSAWDGAQWIGGSDDDLVFHSHYQLIFKMKYSMAIAKGSTNAALIFGANDIRLKDKYKNIFQLKKKHNESYIKLELDISEINNNGLAKLNIYRVGYTKKDSPDSPIKSFDIKPTLINHVNMNDEHDFEIRSAFGEITISLDGQAVFYVEKETGESRAFIHPLLKRPDGAVNLNPVGTGGDYIPFGMVCDFGFSVGPNQKAMFSGVEIFNDRLPNNTLFKESLYKDYNGIFAGKVKVNNGAYVLEGGKHGTLVTANPSRNSVPILRTEFDVEKKIATARLYITARGIYEVSINGKKVGNDYYNPGQTQYNKSHFYQTYDVSSYLETGKNALGAILSEGWWSGLLSFGSVWNHFGDRQSLLAKLEIIYSDGSTKTITTNDKEWKFYNNGPIVYSSLDLGEVYDATKEGKIMGWIYTGFDDSAWKQVKTVPLVGTSFMGEDKELDGTITEINFNQMNLIGQIGNNAGEFKTLTAQSMEEVRPGVYIYNMGQNFVGVPRISISNGRAGDTIILRYAEVLYPNLPEYGDNIGMIMTENYRAAFSQDIYVMKNGAQVFQPKFTSHGYQYIEITGIEKPLPLKSVQGVAISSIINLTSDYKTSNSKVNQLWSNIVWSNVDNFLTIPTDCPQRNERMGWSGDISVFSRTATYISNSNQFLRRHMLAMRDVQKETGRFTDIAPIGGGFGGLLWGSAGITVPWETYQQYNDVALLEEHYDAMVAYIDYLETTIDKETGITSDGMLGDWLGPQNNQLGTPFLTTAYYVYDLWIMKSVATILGKKEDIVKFESIYKKQKDFFNETFLNEDGKTIGLIGGGFNFGPPPAPEPEFKLADTQTSYAVGLALGVFNENIVLQMANNLAETIGRKNKDDDGVLRPENSLMTGFIGTAWVSKALSDNGYNKLAYKLLQNNQYPSWLYSVDQGATTIWERLNGYSIENGFSGNNSMNSFNHYSFGAVGQWMIAYSLGIQRDKPGFRQFILQPSPDPTGEMTWAEGYYDSMYGRVYSKWEVKDGQLIYDAIVPANTSATLYLPAKSESDINKMDNCILKKFEDGKAIFELQSGKYQFKTNLPSVY